MKIVALVPMKGESERVKNKNIRDFCGKPLLCRILETLQSVNSIYKIIVNTDSKTIEDIVKQYDKVVVHHRPASICGNSVPMNKIIEHDINILNDEYYLQTHSTNPILTPETIEKAISTFFKNKIKYDSLFSVTKIKSRFYDKNYSPVNHEVNKLLNTQDLDELYEENSCIYIFSKSSFLKNHNRIGTNPKLFILNRTEAFDIDTEEDFKAATLAYQAKYLF